MADSYVCSKCGYFIGIWGLKESVFIPTLTYHERHESVLNIDSGAHIHVGRGLRVYC